MFTPADVDAVLEGWADHLAEQAAAFGISSQVLSEAALESFHGYDYYAPKSVALERAAEDLRYALADVEDLLASRNYREAAWFEDDGTFPGLPITHWTVLGRTEDDDAPF
jgi:hypothetical protein